VVPTSPERERKRERERERVRENVCERMCVREGESARAPVAAAESILPCPPLQANRGLALGFWGFFFPHGISVFPARHLRSIFFSFLFFPKMYKIACSAHST
jgi:hypothetical protein